MFRRILLVVALLVLFIELNFAAIPQSISYQGVLKNSSTGIAVEGPVSLRFALYNTSSGGSAVWSETQDVTVAQGVFSVTLGSPSNPIPTTLDYNNQLYLGITVLPSTVEMNQRVTINMVPYSQNANTANNAVHATNADNAYAIQGYPVATTEPKAGNLLRFNGTNWEPTKPEVAVCRWNVFDAYDNIGDALGNDPELFCGVAPKNWNSFGYKAESISPNKEILRTFFTRKCYAKKNAVIYNEYFVTPTSSSNRFIIAIFRIKNTTNSNITWSPSLYFTATDLPKQVYASIALNGNPIWSYGYSGLVNQPISIPANATSNKVSTVIFVSASSSFKAINSNTGVGFIKTCRLAFYNNSLDLPNGLEFVDDLDTALDGWDN